MAREDIIMLSSKEMRRVKIINEVLEKHVTQVEAGEILELSERQVRRIACRVKNEGDKGICHKGGGKQSNRGIAEEIKDRILKLYRDRYAGFGPTLAAEKLEEIDKINVSDETLRLWFQEAVIEYKTRKKRPHRQWRQRREHFGELVQMDHIMTGLKAGGLSACSWGMLMMLRERFLDVSMDMRERSLPWTVLRGILRYTGFP